ncbi:hypothetical protein BKA70DRAFT_1227677 [Coprinopsis sp. MPI-PUGE-AT-0042]|nr:hypothetical protein BKA70DRAFT_1227677 [Coprinopsis sp. MPI-PUGE-AT-0042]
MSNNRPFSNLPLHKPTNEKLERYPTPHRNSMAQRRQGKRGTVCNRNVIQGSNGFTINGGTYANGDAPTTIQYNLLAITVNGSPSLYPGVCPGREGTQGGFDYYAFFPQSIVTLYPEFLQGPVECFHQQPSSSARKRINRGHRCNDQLHLKVCWLDRGGGLPPETVTPTHPLFTIYVLIFPKYILLYNVVCNPRGIVAARNQASASITPSRRPQEHPTAKRRGLPFSNITTPLKLANVTLYPSPSSRYAPRALNSARTFFQNLQHPNTLLVFAEFLESSPGSSPVFESALGNDAEGEIEEAAEELEAGIHRHPRHPTNDQQTTPYFSSLHHELWLLPSIASLDSAG